MTDLFLTGAYGLDHALAHAIAAEQHGLGGVWFAEHHFVEYGQIPSATVFAAAVLAATSRITVGTAACVFSARNPVALAEEVAMLHSLYGNRFQLGVARGGPWVENDILGGGMRRYETGFPDWLSTLLDCLSGRGPVTITPGIDGPVTVRVAAVSAATVEIAARHGLPLQLGVEKTSAEVTQLIELWSSVSGIASADHSRIVLAPPVRRDTLAAWLSRRARQDWTAHLDRLMNIHPVTDPIVPRPMCMAEAAGTAEATQRLIEGLPQGRW